MKRTIVKEELVMLTGKVEYAIVLQCAVNSIPRYKRELHKLGLLSEVKRFQDSNILLYIHQTTKGSN